MTRVRTHLNSLRFGAWHKRGTDWINCLGREKHLALPYYAFKPSLNYSLQTVVPTEGKNIVCLRAFNNC